jgi:hypothetical protein
LRKGSYDTFFGNKDLYDWVQENKLIDSTPSAPFPEYYGDF